MKLDDSARAEIFERHLALSAAPPEEGGRRPDVIVWPETSIPFILTDNPDFVCMASAFGIPGETITRKEEVIPALQRMLASKTAYLLHVSIASEDNVWPLVPPGAANEQMLEANS